MPDIINLLPDSVANQIAAGEVIQRPASVVKELLENAVDAGAKNIQLIVKDAGKTLIQIIDNGCGMSDTDARMSFERHATSKIKQASDLFAIQTKGFRGEALASIAAISRVELKSKLHDQDLGTQILVEGSKVQDQQACQCAGGSSFSVKNLFYNTPARRKFLKNDKIELKHIIEEFQRVALVHPDISFAFHHNEHEIFNLSTGSFRQRIVGVFGNAYNERLVPIEESTDLFGLSGFIGKPQFARKTRGEQYLFVNDRFIKSGYFHHAISKSFRELIQDDEHPAYFLKLKVNADEVDVNIHPTKTEVKFENEQAIYAILQAAVRQSLGKYNIMPTIDFDQEQSFQVPAQHAGNFKIPEVKVNLNFNPFESESHVFTKKKSVEGWEKLLEIDPLIDREVEIIQKEIESPATHTGKPILQLHKKYLLTSISGGIAIIDQQRAHERILYEKYMVALATQKSMAQKTMFPETIDLPPNEFGLLSTMIEDVKTLGFDLEVFGKNTFKINAVPVEAKDLNPVHLIQHLLSSIMQEESMKRDPKEKLARSLALQTCIKVGNTLQKEEMVGLIDQLFACEMPYRSPGGKPVLITLGQEELSKKFNS